MTTLISVHNSEGCVGRCDSKCYDAQSDGCDCICGGRNHGAGLNQARENTAELAEGWLERWAEQQGLDPRGLTAAAQGDLFPHGSEPSTDEIRAALRRAKRSAAVAAAALLAGCMPTPAAKPPPELGPPVCQSLEVDGAYVEVCELELTDGTRCAVTRGGAVSCGWRP